MGIEELSTGDWVGLIPNEWDNAPHIIKYIYEDSLLLDGCNTTRHISVIRPIPITARILEANGFVKQVDTFWGEYICVVPEGQICVSIKERHCMVMVLDRRHAPVFYTLKIQHVHQLQHALRMVGLGKEVKL